MPGIRRSISLRIASIAGLAATGTAGETLIPTALPVLPG
jgi:hypothetical protein